MGSKIQTLWNEKTAWDEQKALVLRIAIQNSVDITEWGYPPSAVAQILQTFHLGIGDLLKEAGELAALRIDEEGICAVYPYSSQEDVKKFLRVLPSVFDFVSALNGKIEARNSLRIGVGAEIGTVLRLDYPKDFTSVRVGTVMTHSARHVWAANKSFPLPKGGKLFIHEIVLGLELCRLFSISFKNLPNLLFGHDLSVSELQELIQ